MSSQSMSNECIEQQILAMLQAGPMKQVHIVDAFPLNMYLVVGKVVRDMDARGLITRERCGNTRMVTLSEHTPHS